jgi:hypothetical protein
MCEAVRAGHGSDRLRRLHFVAKDQAVSVTSSHSRAAGVSQHGLLLRHTVVPSHLRSRVLHSSGTAGRVGQAWSVGSRRRGAGGA